MSTTARQLIRAHGTQRYRPLAVHIAEARHESQRCRELIASNAEIGFTSKWTVVAPETASKLDALARALLFTLLGYDETDPDFPDITDL